MSKVTVGIAIGVVVVAGVVWWRISRAIPKDALNPLSDKNLAYQGVNKVVQAVSGDRDDSLGTWMYKLIHGNGDDLVNPTTKR